MSHDHKQNLIMTCTHVIDENQPIGEMYDEIKSDTLICQKCIDKMTIEPLDEINLPDEVHLVCKNCVIEKLKVNNKNSSKN